MKRKSHALAALKQSSVNQLSIVEPSGIPVAGQLSVSMRDAKPSLLKHQEAFRFNLPINYAFLKDYFQTLPIEKNQCFENSRRFTDDDTTLQPVYVAA
ncbi:hypothetical protein IFT84_06375 [Rhizobium sp. CFBP 8762]|uniref:hypothetical protein n=1 Tax=Rhizobium sp. CFBP 8762 TaxID=2775279 RepID=UPI001786199A|nr:hypothetical protein [Rhizobium sp. CFBP 8762]MBD8554148.1 hypothetical protein [Rhizobium sp. CFBP 8762]